MWVWDVPRGQIKEHIIKKSGGLKRHPGGGYNGDCDLFQAPKRDDAEPTEMPVCLGNCTGDGTCHMAIVAWEGRYSDVYDISVFCTCMSDAELDKWVKAKGGQILHL